MTEPLIDEWILEQGEEAAEIACCRNFFDPGEILMAIITGNVDGEPGLDRLALTDRRIILYSRARPQDALSFGYEQLSSVKGKRGKVLTHLGEVNLSARGRSVRFKNIGVDYVDQILDLISRMKR